MNCVYFIMYSSFSSCILLVLGFAGGFPGAMPGGMPGLNEILSDPEVLVAMQVSICYNQS